jgi:hypothetical protein
MPYTTHGYMTAADLAEVRADYDLDLCSCCEAGAFEPLDGTPNSPWCENCDHSPGSHAA